MSIWFILVAMIFMHIFDDYVLQAPCLGDLKQKNFWKKNAPDSYYRYDYVWALFMHGFSWAFMIMLPIAFAHSFNVGGTFVFVLVLNAFVHALIDDAKANLKLINLWTDQICHIMQIVGTFFLFNISMI